MPVTPGWITTCLMLDAPTVSITSGPRTPVPEIVSTPLSIVQDMSPLTPLVVSADATIKNMDTIKTIVSNTDPHFFIKPLLWQKAIDSKYMRL